MTSFRHPCDGGTLSDEHPLNNLELLLQYNLLVSLHVFSTIMRVQYYYFARNNAGSTTDHSVAVMKLRSITDQESCHHGLFHCSFPSWCAIVACCGRCNHGVMRPLCDHCADHGRGLYRRPSGVIIRPRPSRVGQYFYSSNPTSTSVIVALH